MKKNVMMRLASFLLVAVLISTSAISGTYAKYVTDGTAESSARVAKWGVHFDMASDLFLGEYYYDDTDYSSAYTLSVKSEGGNVVAPGTAGNAYSFTTTGVPEVSYIVTFDAADANETVYLLKDDEGNTVSHYPVEFTLSIGGANVEITGGTIDKLTEAIEGCAYFFDVAEGKYYYRTSETGAWTYFSDTDIPSLNLSWVWDFTNGDEIDVLDTILGNLAAGETDGYTVDTDYNLEVAISVTATATQID